MWNLPIWWNKLRYKSKKKNIIILEVDEWFDWKFRCHHAKEEKKQIVIAEKCQKLLIKWPEIVW